MERCKTCNSIVCEITLFNGETKHFCSINCTKADELIETFRDFVQKKINKYNNYIHEDSLVDFLYPEIDKEMIKNLIQEVLRRNYFQIDKNKFIFQKDKIIKLPSQ